MTEKSFGSEDYHSEILKLLNKRLKYELTALQCSMYIEFTTTIIIIIETVLNKLKVKNA